MQQLNIHVFVDSDVSLEIAKKAYDMGHLLHLVTTFSQAIKWAEEEGVPFSEVLINNESPPQLEEIALFFDQTIQEQWLGYSFLAFSSIGFQPFNSTKRTEVVGWIGTHNQKREILSCVDVDQDASSITEALWTSLEEILIDLSRGIALQGLDLESTATQQLRILFENLPIENKSIPYVLAILGSILGRYEDQDQVLLNIAENYLPLEIPLGVSAHANCVTFDLNSQNNLTKVCRDLRELLKSQTFVQVVLGNTQAIDGLLTLQTKQEGIFLELKTNNLLYQNLLSHLENVLVQLKLNPSANLERLSILTPEEEEQILIKWNQTEKIIPYKDTIHKAFEEQARKSPKAVALSFGQENWTYDFLNSYANQLAHCLLAKLDRKIDGQPRVGICVTRGPHMIASLLAVLKAGGCYVPLDTSYPIERLSFIIQDTQLDGVIVDEKTLKEAPAVGKILENLSKINLDIEKSSLATFEGNNLSVPVSTDDLAYIMYTSGSTGEPKGVMIEHHSVLNLVTGETEFCQISESSRILAVASLGFDAAGWDIYGALLNGATLFIADDDLRVSAYELHEFMKEKGVTMATLTPAVVDLMPREKLPDLRILIIMGDKPNEKIMSFWADNTHVVNGYGPTETTVAATLGTYQTGSLSSCIGRPMHNYRAFILDKYQNPVPIGVPGELYISGPGVARGYLNRPDLTEEKFLLSPFSKNETKLHNRTYRTGDLVSWAQDGQINFLGRIDHQVKVRGVRIELPEIEFLLKKVDGIKQVAVIPHGEDSNKRLIAYYTSTGKALDVQEIKAYLSSYLHPAVIPSSYIKLDSFPLTVNGKIDLKNLPLPIMELNNDESYIHPRDEQEQTLSNIFASVLGVNKVGIKDNFFNLGGHSLTATQIAARIQEIMSIHCPARLIFENPTVEMLANVLREMVPHQDNAVSFQRTKLKEGPLTFAQQRLWYLFQFDRENCAYNLPIALEFKGKLKLEALNQTFETLIHRHESFRTIFENREGTPVQVVQAPQKFSLEAIPVDQKHLDETLTRETRIPFNIELDPPVRIRLFQIGPDHHVLLIVKHNMITDAWSEGVLVREFNNTYRAYSQGSIPALEAITFQSIDGAVYQRQVLTPEKMTNSLDYWKAKLQDYQNLDFPTDFQRPDFLNDSGYRLTYRFKDELWHQLKYFGKQQGTTPFMILVASLKILLARYTQQYDVIVGTATAGRNRSELEGITGFFVNTIPLRTILDPEMSWSQVLSAVRESCLEAYQHEEVPFEWIVDHIGVIRELSRAPIFQIMVILQNANEGFQLNLPDLLCNSVSVQTQTSMYEMSWNFIEDESSLSINLDFNTQLFEIETIQRLLLNFEQSLASLVKAETLPISNLDILSRSEQTHLISCANGPQPKRLNTSILDLFENARISHGKRVAVRCGDEIINYDDLGRRVDLLASQLISQDGVESKNLRIGVLLDRSIDMVTSIFAILKAGGTYIPLDPDFPKNRLEYMIENAQLKFVLSCKSILQEVGALVVNVPLLDLNSLQGNASSVTFPEITSNDLAYIIYTSGSTGNPKGVMISHGALLNLVEDMYERIPCRESDRFLSITTISFDIFGLELFVPLVSGAELILCPTDIAKNPVHLVNYANEQQPSIMQATPTMWSLIADHLDTIPTILCGGEAMSKALAEKLIKISHKLLNVYGPTETTIWSTSSVITDSDKITIGKPLSHTSCYVMDEKGYLMPERAIGELCIGGLGLAQGYWQREDLTKNAFFVAKSVLPIERLYRTGDLVQWTKEGNLLYKGRKDFQVKIRGNRIELGEIESVLRTHPGVQECVVNPVGEGTEKYLVAYFIPQNQEEQLTAETLRNYLETRLPPAMLPSAFMQMDTFPLTSNKKIDRKKLPLLDQDFASSARSYVPPETPLEQEVQEIWEDILKVKGLSIIEPFFLLGGNSLHIPQIVARINTIHQTAITIRDFILHSTIRELAEFMEITKSQYQHVA